MTDALITDLAKIGSLRITSRTSVMRYKGTKRSIQDIGRELNVDAVVEGTVTRSGSRVRITAQLIQVSTDMHLWAETYERDVSEILDSPERGRDRHRPTYRRRAAASRSAASRESGGVRPLPEGALFVLPVHEPGVAAGD